MRIRVWMMGVLKPMEPENNEFEALEGMTVDELLHTLDVAATTSAFTINEKIASDRQLVLQENDRVRLIGLVGGG